MLREKTGLWLMDADNDEVLESIPVNANSEDVHNSQFDAGVFLHGECDIFALALHNEFGYPLSWTLDDEWEERTCGDDPYAYIVHAFCLVPKSDDVFGLADVRGISDDDNEFFEPFEDFFTPPGCTHPELTAEMIISTGKKRMSDAEFELFYNEAKRIIEEHRDWYTL